MVLDALRKGIIEEIESCKSAEELREILESRLKQVQCACHMESFNNLNSRKLRILHFNDVYNIGPRETEPCGGAARFATVLREYYKGGSKFNGIDPIVIFAGDAFNPSILSVNTQGRHMMYVLNQMKIDCAVFGNHDFDFGEEVLEEFVKCSNFPWLISNVASKHTGKPLANGMRTHIVTTSEGIRLGFVGLVEDAWMTTLSMIDEDAIVYEDFVTCGRRLAGELRDEGAHIIIAITHMRLPNDKRLALEAGDCIDLILGGHDHDYWCGFVGQHNTFIAKSGTDFRDLTLLDLEADSNGKLMLQDQTHIEITSDIKPDEFVEQIVNYYETQLSIDEGKVIGEICVALDARFAKLRTEETNTGNFIADIMRQGCRADVAILNSGTIRLDDIIPAGKFTIGHIRGLLPMVDNLVVVAVSGQDLKNLLENGVSMFPRQEGRFPCVSGVRFAFDPMKPPNARIETSSIIVNGQELDLAKTYNVATKEYLSLGKDGYDAFLNGTIITNADDSPMLSILIRNYFRIVSVVNGFSLPMESSHKARVNQLVMEAAQRFKRTPTHRHRASSTITAPLVDGRILNLNRHAVHHSSIP